MSPPSPLWGRHIVLPCLSVRLSHFVSAGYLPLSVNRHTGFVKVETFVVMRNDVLYSTQMYKLKNGR